jgi:hypothetical protein
MKPALIFLLGILFAACAAKQGQPMAFPTTCNDADDGKYVAIAGYLTDDGSVYCSDTGGRMDCNLTLTEKPDGGAKILASVAQGTGKSSIEDFGSSYKKSDLKIHDNSGGMVKIGDKVTLTGKFSVIPGGSSCFITVDKIDK